ncbi:SHOCT domain-containing protein (plasmid) [Aliarcobacter cibarius]|uniref:SHOCT domain-containing protein n=1 Tax=Aliarcobacter cibarius TaxID=255507 RepID=UPI0012492A49|nr:SHOCT domain-containing protein [Aliarcobacter cibarius]QEZ90216.1 SHOCT domain-containing protein [Aliarcobacter cibarius]
MSLEILEKIEKLSELKDKGILTQEEFENKKRYLLDENNNNNEMSFTKKTEGTNWLPIPSFIFGLLAFLASFDESEWNMDEKIGVLFFISIAFILGFISISIQNNGKALSIAGIVLSILASLAILDRFEYIN